MDIDEIQAATLAVFDAEIPADRVIPSGPAEWMAAADRPQPIPSPPAPSQQLVPEPARGDPSPLNELRAKLQPIAGNLLIDVAYWELLKRNASPRTFLEFVRFAFAADLEGKPGAALNQQIVIQAPFPRGPLDELPPHMRVE